MIKHKDPVETNIDYDENLMETLQSERETFSLDRPIVACRLRWSVRKRMWASYDIRRDTEAGKQIW